MSVSCCWESGASRFFSSSSSSSFFFLFFFFQTVSEVRFLRRQKWKGRSTWGCFAAWSAPSCSFDSLLRDFFFFLIRQACLWLSCTLALSVGISLAALPKVALSSVYSVSMVRMIINSDRSIDWWLNGWMGGSSKGLIIAVGQYISRWSSRCFRCRS